MKFPGVPPPSFQPISSFLPPSWVPVSHLMPSSVGTTKENVASDLQVFPSTQEAIGNILETKGEWFRATRCDPDLEQPKGREALDQCWLKQSKVSRWEPVAGA